MAPKKTNIKIKRSKFNLYNKKKSKARRALRIIITIVVVCGLGVLGYGLGKPIIKYLQDNNSSRQESDTSALLSSIINSELMSSTADEMSSTNSTSETSEPVPLPHISEKIYFLSDSAVSSESSLTSELAKAKSEGCSVAAVTVKDTTGFMLYKTNITSVKDTEVVSGTLSASQIASLISKEGLVPAARINTLMDRLSPPYVDGSYRIVAEQGGGSWHDNKPEKGGKLWLSPFKTQTAQYIGDITSELSAAGFKHIICANTRYPAFHTVDITTYLTDLPLTDSAKRAQALWNVVSSAKSSAEKNGAELWLEMSGTSLIAESKNCTDAELVLDKTQLKNIKIAVNYDLTSSTPGTTDTPDASSSSGVSGSPDYNRAKDFAVKAKTVLNDAQFAVRLPQTLTGEALNDVKKAFSEADITIL